MSLHRVASEVVLEEQNASSRRKLEEMASLDGRSPEGARRCTRDTIKALRHRGRVGNLVSDCRKEELRKLRLELAKKLEKKILPTVDQSAQEYGN